MVVPWGGGRPLFFTLPVFLVATMSACLANVDGIQKPNLGLIFWQHEFH
jgi:hypothetical protein